jgi:ATP adenylyltransferase
MEYFFNFDKMSYLTGNRPEGCILCRVRDGDRGVENLTVHRTEFFIVSVNLYPYNPGHVIIFPRRHLKDLREFSRDEHDDLDGVLDMTLSVLDATHGPAGYNVGVNMGHAAGASIEHLHYHVIPRYQREIGIAELIAGKRVLVEDPRATCERLAKAFAAIPGGLPQERRP